MYACIFVYFTSICVSFYVYLVNFVCVLNLFVRVPVIIYLVGILLVCIVWSHSIELWLVVLCGSNLCFFISDVLFNTPYSSYVLLTLCLVNVLTLCVLILCLCALIIFLFCLCSHSSL